jgi:hypothetical protein
MGDTMNDTLPDKKRLAKAPLKIFVAVGLLVVAVAIGLTGKLWAAVPQPAGANFKISASDFKAATPLASATPTISPVFAALPGAVGLVARITAVPPVHSQVITLTAPADVIGWASDLDGRSHFNVPTIHVGSFQGDTYYGALQFDLSKVPPDVTVSYAALELVGFDDRHLGQTGLWQLQILEANGDEQWSEIDFETLTRAEVAAPVPLDMNTNTLAADKTNLFIFDVEARAVLAQRLVEGVVSFRLDGPITPEDNLFSWDSGYSRHADPGRMVVFWLGVIPPDTPAAPPTPNYVIVTSTFVPENIITVAAMAAEATSRAEKFGTATPIPENWVTPIIVTGQPTPANMATTIFRQQEATAQAFLYGTGTPAPSNVWTATPTATPIPPANHSTNGDTAFGSLLPLPPRPTATVTPIYLLVEGEVATPWASPTATVPAPPVFIPPELAGKIVFLSNRSGGPEPLGSPLIYMIDPDGGNLAVLTGREFYRAAIAHDNLSTDQRFRVFVKDALRFDNKQVPALYFYDYYYNVEEQITHFGTGASWDPVWSPTREQIAFVSNDSSDDEIWVINRDGTGARQLTKSNTAYNAREIGKDTFIPEVNGQPSWSPDGSQIVFWSNRSGHRQIWIMNADGSNAHTISTTNHDDWNPVWIKYTNWAP